jgi:hypothetical protein
MAMEAGNDAALDLLFSKVPEYGAISKVGRFALVCDNNPTSVIIVRKLTPRDPDFFDIEEYYGSPAGDLLEGALSTPSVEFFDYLMSIKESTSRPTIPKERIRTMLFSAVNSGWMEMTRHLLTLGARPGLSPSPLEAACLYKPAFVSLMLDHMAPITNDTMSAAAKNCIWDVLNRCRENGAQIDKYHEPMLVAAMAREKTELVKELMSLGTRIDSKFAKRALHSAVQRARQDGLESMLKLLKELNGGTTV